MTTSRLERGGRGGFERNFSPKGNHSNPINFINHSLNLNFHTLKWQGGEPKSVCSEPCPAGSIRNFQDQCCWVCVKCNIDSYA